MTDKIEVKPQRDLESAWESYHAVLCPKIAKGSILYGELQRAFYTGAETMMMYCGIKEVRDTPIGLESHEWAKKQQISDAVIRLNVLHQIIESIGARRVSLLAPSQSPRTTDNRDHGAGGREQSDAGMHAGKSSGGPEPLPGHDAPDAVRSDQKKS